MNHNPVRWVRRKAAGISTRARRICTWAYARRWIALSFLLRGLCYGTGTAAAGLAAFWIQNRM
ncbi:hypothetical protein ACFCZ1_29125 [Streptomyces sp. NPDC056224]|uniref:hypothetical protein n=1 Tax=Streptomyces sp. NPDC056224 TaxID=3345750 RepID=UPI0035D6A41A